MSVPAKSRWGAGGHQNAEERRAETLPPCRRATPSPPAAPRNGRRRPWQPRGHLTKGLFEEAPARPGRCGGPDGDQAPQQRAGAAIKALRRPYPPQHRDTAAAGPGNPGATSPETFPRRPRAVPAAAACLAASRRLGRARPARAGARRPYPPQHRDAAAAGPGNPGATSPETFPRCPRGVPAAAACLAASRRLGSRHPPLAPRRGKGKEEMAPRQNSGNRQ